MIHTLNIVIHVLAGTIGLVIGFLAIFSTNRGRWHKRWGKIFIRLLAIVVVSGFFGWLFFRSNPFLLILTVLSGYVCYAGIRCIKLREKRATGWDALIATLALLIGTSYVICLHQSTTDWNPTVIYSTVGALAFVTLYDLLKYFWLHSRLQTWWLYEHIYKMISAHSALFAAFTGTVLPNFKPYSQVGPSVLSLWLIAIFIFIEMRKQKKRTFAPVQHN